LCGSRALTQRDVLALPRGLIVQPVLLNVRISSLPRDSRSVVISASQRQMSIWSSSLRRRMPRIYSSITAAQHGGSTRTQHAGKGPDRLRATQSFLPCDALHGEQPPASGWLDPCMLAPSNVVRLLAGDEAGSQISAAFVSHWPERPASPLVVVSGMQARKDSAMSQPWP
jgi:hypothetical protein